jgi:hypothetical protein
MKARYSQSRLSQFFRCPKAFDLYGEFEPDISSTTQSVMREGLLFEYYTFENTPTNEKFTGDFDEKALIGKKTDKTLEPLKDAASFVSKFFTGGEAYVKLEWEGEFYDLTGEADYIGAVEFVDSWGEAFSFPKAITDLKWTKNIHRVWDEKRYKEDFLQSYMYVYIHWKLTGEILPFVYIVVEPKDDKPFTRAICITHTERELMSWFEPLLNHVHFTFDKKPNYYDPGACVGHKHKNEGACWFLKFCNHGRNVVGGFREFAGFQLESKFDPDLHVD